METIVFQYCWDDGIEFKSYYVVWKHTNIVSNIVPYLGLNRTMQYGNAHLGFADEWRAVCLNRTMQYGNVTFLQKKAAAMHV